MVVWVGTAPVPPEPLGATGPTEGRMVPLVAFVDDQLKLIWLTVPCTKDSGVTESVQVGGGCGGGKTVMISWQVTVPPGPVKVPV